MTNNEVIKALKAVKTYTAAQSLDEIDYAISVFTKLEEAGVTNPLDKTWLKQISNKKDVK